MTATRIKTVRERVAELLAAAPPITDEQRQTAVQVLATSRPNPRTADGGDR